MQWPTVQNRGVFLTMRKLLDTDILSEVFRGRDANVKRNAEAYLRVFGYYSLSVITVAEMTRGFQKAGTEDKLRTFLRFLEQNDAIPVRKAESVLAGRITGDLERHGTPIGHLDPFIAATAIVHRLPLVTGNTRHFVRIQELGYPLVLQNWREPQPNG
jgi:tRNA(fMet)-specific endonuclease VapC